MNRIIRRGMCALGVAVAGSAAGIGFAGTASAAEQDATWAMYSDGCAYLSDGYASYQAACPNVPGGTIFWDFYVARSGQWSYGFTASTPDFFGASAGCSYFWADAATTVYLGSSCQ